MATFSWSADSKVEIDASSSVHPIHGDIRGIRGEATVDVVDGALDAGADHSFDVRDFDVKPPKLGPLQVHPEVKITLRLVGRDPAGSARG